MIFGKTRLELKVGIFVFIGLVILATFILSIGKFKTWNRGYRTHFIFKFVNGVKFGAPVRFSGVDVGEVKDINFISSEEGNEPKVKITCLINNEVKIPQDSTIWVNTLGLLGEKYIEIIPGLDYANYLAAGEELVGEDPIPMHEVTVLAKKIGENIDEAFTKLKNKEGTMGKLLYDDAIHEEMIILFKELEMFIEDIKANPWKLFWKSKEKAKKK